MFWQVHSCLLLCPGVQNSEYLPGQPSGDLLLGVPGQGEELPQVRSCDTSGILQRAREAVLQHGGQGWGCRKAVASKDLFASKHTPQLIFPCCKCPVHTCNCAAWDGYSSHKSGGPVFISQFPVCAVLFN